MRTVEIGDLSIGDGHPPKIMSVLNMSSNSGYKPSVHTEAERAAAVVDEELVPAGADIIDIGLQSANPKYETKPVEHELDRLETAAAVLDNVETDPVFSLETRYAEVAEAGIQRGFDIVNDVCGFADPEMRPTCEAYDVPVIKMASPPDLERPGALKTADDVFAALRRGGFTDRTILDPAFGGWYDERTFEDNWEMFRRLSEFRAFGRPLLTGTNREDFLGALAGRPETENQLAVSLAAATLEVDRGAHIIRTHDTETTHDVVQVAHALSEDRTTRTDTVTVTELSGVSKRELDQHLALSEEAVGTADRTATLSFVVNDPPEEDVDAIREATVSSGASLGLFDSHLVLAGTAETFEAFLAAFPATTSERRTVAAAIRAGLGDERA